MPTASDRNLREAAVTPRTHEGAPARVISAEMTLRRSVLACMLWEDQFYEDRVEIAGRIAQPVPKVEAAQVTRLPSRLVKARATTCDAPSCFPEFIQSYTVYPQHAISGSITKYAEEPLLHDCWH